MDQSFKDFVIDEESTEKMVDEIAKLIKKVVKKDLISFDEKGDSYLITFKSKTPRAKETHYEVGIVPSYLKKYAKGMVRMITITTSHETNSHKNTTSLNIEPDRLSDADYAKTLKDIEEYYSQLVK